MTRERRRQKLWTELTELQRQYLRQKLRRLPTSATERAMVKKRAEIMKLEDREDRDRQRKAA